MLLNLKNTFFFFYFQSINLKIYVYGMVHLFRLTDYLFVLCSKPSTLKADLQSYRFLHNKDQ